MLFSAAAPAAPHNSANTLYRGKTAQGAPIRIAASADQITLLRFNVKLLCRDGGIVHANVAGFEATPLTGAGRFSDVQYGKSDIVSWEGRARPGEISGRLRVKLRLERGVRCDSQTMTFAAGRGGG